MATNEEKCIEIIRDLNEKRRLGRLHATLNAILYILLVLLLLFSVAMFKDLLVTAVFYFIALIPVLFIKFSRPKSEVDLVHFLKRYCLAEDIPRDIREFISNIPRGEEETWSRMPAAKEENIYNL